MYVIYIPSKYACECCLSAFNLITAHDNITYIIVAAATDFIYSPNIIYIIGCVFC